MKSPLSPSANLLPTGSSMPTSPAKPPAPPTSSPAPSQSSPPSSGPPHAPPFLLCTACTIIWRTHATGLKNRLKQVVYLVESTDLARLLQSSGTRHLHTHISENSATVAMAAAHLIHIPFRMTVHGSGEFFHPRQWGLAEKIKRSAFTVCISNFCRSQCMVFATPPSFTRLHVIHCGLGPDFLAQAAASPITLPIPSSASGRLCPGKGFLTLLDAAAQLRA